MIGEEVESCCHGRPHDNEQESVSDFSAFCIATAVCSHVCERQFQYLVDSCSGVL